MYCFQDDLITYEDEDTFNKKYQEIYPSEMILKNTNISLHEVNYLDLNIKVQDNKYIYKKYDKTNNYKLLSIQTFLPIYPLNLHMEYLFHS